MNNLTAMNQSSRLIRDALSTSHLQTVIYSSIFVFSFKTIQQALHKHSTPTVYSRRHSVRAQFCPLKKEKKMQALLYYYFILTAIRLDTATVKGTVRHTDKIRLDTE